MPIGVPPAQCRAASEAAVAELGALGGKGTEPEDGEDAGRYTSWSERSGTFRVDGMCQRLQVQLELVDPRLHVRKH